MKYEIFISYSRRDGILLAAKLAESLRQAGLAVFWDQDSIPAGANWEQTLDNALEEAEHILVLLTPLSVISEEVTAEWRPMLSRSKNVIPLMYLACDIPRRLSMRQYIDFRDENRYSAALTELVNAINTLTPQSVQLDMTGAELMQRAQVYFEAGQNELAAKDYLLVLKDADGLLRGRAARFLGKSRVMSALGKVVQCTHEETDLGVKNELFTTIMRYAELTDWRSVVPDLMEQLRPYLEAEDVEIRRQTVRIYAYGKAKELVPDIVHVLRHDAAPSVRTQAALALGRLKTGNAFQGLLTALLDDDENVRIAAIQAVGVFKNESTTRYIEGIVLGMSSKDRSAKVRNAASEVLADLRK